MYDHGESVNPKECIECECLDGLMKCKRIDPETMCPPLSCSPQEQFSVPGNCCKFCKGKGVPMPQGSQLNADYSLTIFIIFHFLSHLLFFPKDLIFSIKVF